MKVFAWVNSSLDGACSAIALKNILKCELTTGEANSHDFPGLLKGWVIDNFSSYDKVFIIGLIIPDKISQLLDNERVIIVDNYNIKQEYKHAKTIFAEKSSCTEVLLDKLSRQCSDELQLLYNMAGDYCSNALSISNSIKLNAVFMGYNRPKVDKFIKRYEHGFSEFDAHEKNSIKLYFNRLKEAVTDTEFFTGVIKDSKVVSCFANHAMNDIANLALKKYSAEVAIVVNLVTRTVLFRRSKNNNIKVNILAEKLCSGSGRDDVAAGSITDTFLAFSKTLCQCM